MKHSSICPLETPLCFTVSYPLNDARFIAKFSEDIRKEGSRCLTLGTERRKGLIICLELPFRSRHHFKN